MNLKNRKDNFFFDIVEQFDFGEVQLNELKQNPGYILLGLSLFIVIFCILFIFFSDFRYSLKPLFILVYITFESFFKLLIKKKRLIYNQSIFFIGSLEQNIAKVSEFHQKAIENKDFLEFDTLNQTLLSFRTSLSEGTAGGFLARVDYLLKGKSSYFSWLADHQSFKFNKSAESLHRLYLETEVLIQRDFVGFYFVKCILISCLIILLLIAIILIIGNSFKQLKSIKKAIGSFYASLPSVSAFLIFRRGNNTKNKEANDLRIILEDFDKVYQTLNKESVLQDVTSLEISFMEVELKFNVGQKSISKLNMYSVEDFIFIHNEFNKLKSIAGFYNMLIELNIIYSTMVYILVFFVGLFILFLSLNLILRVILRFFIKKSESKKNKIKFNAYAQKS